MIFPIGSRKTRYRYYGSPTKMPSELMWAILLVIFYPLFLGIDCYFFTGPALYLFIICTTWITAAMIAAQFYIYKSKKGLKK